MTATAYNSFAYSAGQDMDLNLTIVDASGNAVDLTGAIIRFVATKSNDLTNPVCDTAASPQTATYTITGEATGEVTITIADTVTDSFLGDYYYEVKVTDAAGAEGITNRGVLTFEASVT